MLHECAPCSGAKPEGRLAVVGSIPEWGELAVESRRCHYPYAINKQSCGLKRVAVSVDLGIESAADW